MVLLFRKVSSKSVYAVLTGVSLVCLVFTTGYAWDKLEVKDYLSTQMSDSTFIEDEYVDPKNVKIQFPEKKRNLIYIYLESMEVTYSDKADGGAFDENVIPELTELAQENECFAGDSTELNGGFSPAGTTWTIAGMFAETSGLPLKVSIGGNKMNTQSAFFPTITCMGDILKSEGYRQVLLIGSDAEFAGRKMYFDEHGSYEMHDYGYAKEQGEIPQDYYVWWGYEDEKLFANAKKELKELADRDEPFNLTLLTVDTHTTDGYVCELCDDKFGDNQYANVIACSSKQVSDFVKWVQQQDFYENTTIVLSGDHPTMDADFCEDVDKNYVRKVYTAYINAATEPENTSRREYTTLDNFPTTLAALGAEIEGNRLGLGTNLFSERQTLAEEYGTQELNRELSKASVFMDKLAGVDETKEYTSPTVNDEESAKVNVKRLDSTHALVTVSEVNRTDIKSIEIEIKDEQGENSQKVTAELQADRTYEAEIDLAPYARDYAQMVVSQETKKGKTELYNYRGNLLLACESDLVQYLETLKEFETDEYSFFMTTGEYADYALTEEVKEKIRQLGFTENLDNAENICYYAIWNAGERSECAEEQQIETKGQLPNGRTFTVNSAGIRYNRASNTIIAGADCGLHYTGFVISVYDNVEGRLVNCWGVDPYRYPSASVQVEKTGTNEIMVNATVEDGYDTQTEGAEIFYWDANNPGKPAQCTMKQQEDGTYTAVIKVDENAIKETYIELYVAAIKSGGGKETKREYASYKDKIAA